MQSDYERQKVFICTITFTFPLSLFTLYLCVSPFTFTFSPFILSAFCFYLVPFMFTFYTFAPHLSKGQSISKAFFPKVILKDDGLSKNFSKGFPQRLLKVSSITTFQKLFSKIFSKAVLQGLQKAFQIQKAFPKPVQSLFQSSKAFPMAYPKPLEKAVPKFRSSSQKLC